MFMICQQNETEIERRWCWSESYSVIHSIMLNVYCEATSGQDMTVWAMISVWLHSFEFLSGILWVHYMHYGVCHMKQVLKNTNSKKTAFYSRPS